MLAESLVWIKVILVTVIVIGIIFASIYFAYLLLLLLAIAVVSGLVYTVIKWKEKADWYDIDDDD